MFGQSYEDRLDMIVTHAWESWTKNGMNLDEEDRRETEKTARDAANNTYTNGISDSEWLTATLRRLRTDFVSGLEQGRKPGDVS